MQPSMFNVRVPLADRGEVFLMNTLTDAQLLVSGDVAALLDRLASPGAPQLSAVERAAVDTLAEHGFLVENRDAERGALAAYFAGVREDRTQLRVTVLTTLQCNLACDYCYQGDHGDSNTSAAKMSLDSAVRVAAWVEARLDEIGPESLAVTFFGGEPLLNLPVMFYLAERLWASSRSRDVRMQASVITNGLLLTPEVVDRLLPFGLTGVKVTLDGDRETHDRVRRLRGGQGTFDRIIENVRRVAGRVPISIGGNFDVSSVDSYPALLDFLRAQDFAPAVGKIAFKPVIAPPEPNGVIPLMAVGADGQPAGATCMTSAGAGSGICDSCHFVDEKLAFLREETKKRGFRTPDGVHMGPCEIHRRHAHTIGPDGSLYACPGFTGDLSYSTGHIDGAADEARRRAAARFEALAAWEACDDCVFIPVCAGGCTTAAHAELGDLDRPSCHKASFEAGVRSLAMETTTF